MLFFILRYTGPPLIPVLRLKGSPCLNIEYYYYYCYYLFIYLFYYVCLYFTTHLLLYTKTHWCRLNLTFIVKPCPGRIEIEKTWWFILSCEIMIYRTSFRLKHFWFLLDTKLRKNKSCAGTQLEKESNWDIGFLIGWGAIFLFFF